jgi:hypothetical protein
MGQTYNSTLKTCHQTIRLVRPIRTTTPKQLISAPALQDWVYAVAEALEERAAGLEDRERLAAPGFSEVLDA